MATWGNKISLQVLKKCLFRVTKNKGLNLTTQAYSQLLISITSSHKCLTMCENTAS